MCLFFLKNFENNGNKYSIAGYLDWDFIGAGVGCCWLGWSLEGLGHVSTPHWHVSFMAGCSTAIHKNYQTAITSKFPELIHKPLRKSAAGPSNTP